MNAISSFRRTAHRAIWSNHALVAIAFLLSLVIIVSYEVPGFQWIASGIVFASGIVAAVVVAVALLAMALFAICGVDVTRIGEE